MTARTQTFPEPPPTAQDTREQEPAAWAGSPYPGPTLPDHPHSHFSHTMAAPTTTNCRFRPRPGTDPRAPPVYVTGWRRRRRRCGKRRPSSRTPPPPLTAWDSCRRARPVRRPHLRCLPAEEGAVRSSPARARQGLSRLPLSGRELGGAKGAGAGAGRAGSLPACSVGALSTSPGSHSAVLLCPWAWGWLLNK